MYVLYLALNITNLETERHVRALAAVRGQTTVEAVNKAVQD